MKKSKKSGFTLVELIAVIGILGIISSIILSLFHSGLFMYSNGMEIEATETNGRLALEELTMSIKITKVIIPTSKITDVTNTNYQGLYYDALKTHLIAQSNLVAYIEDYSGARYIYAYETNNVKKELHKIMLKPQPSHTYSIPNPTAPTELFLTKTDIDNVNLGSSSQNVKLNAASYITYYSGSVYSGSNPYPTLLYDNFGTDCYLVVNNASGTQVKVKLTEDSYNNFDVATGVSDTKICGYLGSISIENKGTQGEMTINIINGSHSEAIDTYVNVLNQNNY